MNLLCGSVSKPIKAMIPGLPQDVQYLAAEARARALRHDYDAQQWLDNLVSDLAAWRAGYGEPDWGLIRASYPS